MSNIKWNPSDLFYLRTNAATKTDKEIMEDFVKMGRFFTLKAIRLKRRKEGIVKDGGKGVCRLRRVVGVPNQKVENMEQEKNIIVDGDDSNNNKDGN